ncbi:hypothetical protein ACH474_07550 [Nocardia rhamnosiphila]|uniref:Xaa-Pro dipeptidase n=1 Tax=Nocardia rhamnosiphila TaxID=426716 RepID=A0ABV2WLD7_9NOCA|nr:hypothetical protein [Nocardia rhamnosiphila]
MNENLLPPAFAEFERFARTWCLATEAERWERRLNSSMDEMTEFYEAFFPRLDEAIVYCDKFPLDDLPDDALHLLQLIYSLAMVAMAIEIFLQPRPVDSADAELERISEPWP